MTPNAIIVPGIGVNSDGSLSQRSLERLRQALEMYKEYPQSALVFSGVEAEAMKEEALKNGISPQNIHCESRSTDTLGNAYFTARDFVIPNQWQNVFVVTSDFHAKRTEYCFKKVLGSKCSWIVKQVNHNLKNDEISRALAKERSELLLLKLSLWWVPNGSLGVIKFFMTYLHPWYAWHSKATKRLAGTISHHVSTLFR